MPSATGSPVEKNIVDLQTIARLVDEEHKKKKKGNGAAEGPHDPRPAVRLDPSRSEEVVRAIDAIISALDPPQIFQQAGVHALARVCVLPEDAFRRLEVKVPMGTVGIVLMDEPQALVALSRNIRFELETDGPKGPRRRPVDCPTRVCRAWLGQAGGLTNPLLNGISTIPLLREDGSLSPVQQGYDWAFGIYVTSDVKIELDPELDLKGAQNAFARVLKVFSQFPFSDENDRERAGGSLAAFAAYIVGLVMRHCVPIQPAFVSAAPKFGTGKTLLIRAGNVLVYGVRPLEVGPLKGDDSGNEERKRFATFSAKGVQSLLIDNVVGAIESEVLAQVLTTDIFTDRMLGKNSAIGGRRPLIAISSNNAKIGYDNVRRTIYSYLDAKMERPDKGREFHIANLLEHITTYRPALLTDLYNAIAAYLRAGAPDMKATRLGSFEEWSRLVSNCVMWLGLADPCRSQKASEKRDTQAVAIKGLVRAWWHTFGSKPVETREITKAAEMKDSDIGRVLENFGEVSNRSLGRLLGKHENQTFEFNEAPHKLVLGRSPKNQEKWAVREPMMEERET